jgi:hypothetical protein
MPEHKEVYNQPFHVIVEGSDDRELIKRLLANRGIDGYQVGCGQGKDNRCLGKDGFYKRIEAILASSVVDVKGYVIVADCDDDPADRLKNALSHFEKPKAGLPRPNAAFTKATGTDSKGSDISTAVIMIPADITTGGLETLLLSCCSDIRDHEACIDGFCTCVHRPNRRKLDNDKVRLRAFIAATHEHDPSLALSAWVTSEHCPFQLNHPSLNFITDFLKTFKT